MYHRAKHVLLLSLLLQLMPIRDAHNTSYKENIVDDRIEEKLELLGPRALLKYQNYNRVSSDCARELAVYERGINRKETWALQMLDSSSKLPTGILRGNLIDIGMYDECIETHGISIEGIEIHGKHCMYSIDRMVTLDKRIPYNPVLSICMPKRCTNDDLFMLINGSLDSNTSLKSFGMSVSSATCTNTDRTFIDQNLIIFGVVMALYVGFVLCCTALHLRNLVFPPEKRNETSQTILRFSYIKNSKDILSLEPAQNDIPVIHGLRAINTFWLIILHEIFFQFFSPLVNFVDFNKYLTSWVALVPLIGLYTVDTFFVLSGFLAAFTYFKQRERNAKINVFSFYVHRFLRLAPAVAVVLYSTIVLIPKIPLIASGPRFDWIQSMFVDGCSSKWLPILFFVPNIVDKDNYCLQQLWSVAVDVQLMWISPLILYILYKKPKAGLTVLMCLLLGSVASYAFILGTNGYSAIFVSHTLNLGHLLEAFKNVYEVPYTRASPWLLGVIFGYITSKNILKPNDKIVNLGWFLALVSFAFCIIGTKSFTSETYEYNYVWETTFAALAKPLWGFGISWIIYAGIYNPRGFVATIFSSKYFLPFSRMSYSLCILHVLFPALIAATAKTPKYLSFYLIAHSSVSNILLDLVLAFVFSITFEMPLRNLETMFSGRKNTDIHKLKAK